MSTAIETSTNANSVPMLERFETVPMSSSPAGMPTTNPATHVATAGVRIARVNVAEDVGQQAVARHGKPDARLAELEHQDRRDHAQHGADQHEQLDPAQAAATRLEREALEGIHHRRAVAHDGVPWHDAAEDDGDSAVEKRAGNKRGEDAEGQIALRVLAFLCRGGDGVEPDVGEEDDGPAGEHARPPIGHEGMPVHRLDEAGGRKDKRRIATILTRTRMLFVRADSRMPRTSTTVSTITNRNAGMLNPKCQPGA